MRHPRKWFLIGLLILIPGYYSPKAQVRGPLVVSDRWPESTDMFTWSRDIFRLDGVEHSSERDRAISFFNWLRLYNRLCEGVGGMAHAYEGAWGKEGFVFDLHKHLFVYGWGYCSTHSMIAEGFWQEYMKDSLAADRVIVMHEDGGYHTMYRLRLEGKFSAFDARYGYYLLEKDTPEARILDWDGIGDDKNILANRHYKNRCRPFFEFPQKEFERALWIKPKPVFASEDAWRAAGTEPEVVFRDRQYKMGTKFHDMRFSLPRGSTIERHWDNRMQKWYVPKEDKDMFLPEGRFYRIGASMVGADGEKNDPNWKYIKPYLTRVPEGLGYPEYLEGDLSLGQAWGKLSYDPVLSRGDLEQLKIEGQGLKCFAEAPFIRPAEENGAGEWVLEFYSPYILVDGLISGKLEGGEGDSVEVAFRSQVPKRLNISQAEEWLPWRTISAKPGPFLVTLDRADAAEGGSSFHGTYRWQLKISLVAGGQRLVSNKPRSQVGLDALHVAAFFENGIMSIPQIFAGDNTIRFKVEDPAKVEGDILVTYRWQAAQGEQCNRKRITPDEFYKDNEAVYHLEAPGLERCNSLSISYP
ncbi:MAG: hypothetical protein A3F83_05620 [Candidatus Glassbacteria bacterium RIFCSPLOWO2_12_FULL_58_11]|uniref:Uncharacterized protein n=1 Tax=Candidatus Glassbacteria bacterium RIFCSPLOWO2_12_FULL_58_11 TaxID=1817867 RepID=A0A1F5Z010_9BACT|nr:MAG: hypothetical protein A3F83_05620 [Candidatus Glassbacteria bacterium RIFCSPLOWO2_12_FULL_58_11]